MHNNKNNTNIYIYKYNIIDTAALARVIRGRSMLYAYDILIASS